MHKETQSKISWHFSDTDYKWLNQTNKAIESSSFLKK